VVVSIHVVADLHGAADELRKSLPAGTTLLLLGDLLNVIDYIEMSGILVDLFGRDTVAEVARLRTTGDVERAGQLIAERSAGRRDEIRAGFAARAAEQYEEVFAALPDLSYVILGNVDVPQLAHSFAAAAEGVKLPDATAVEIEGERFGFVGGALPTPLKVAGEITAEEMRTKVEALPDVDILCSHIPPAIPELCFDTLAGKMEQGSEDLLTYIRDVQPRRAYFGHVHQPLVSSMSIGRTVCINVGYFRSTRRPWPHLKEEPWPTP